MIALASRRRSLEPRWLGLAIGNHRLPRIVDTLTADSHSSRRHIGTETNHHQYPWRKHKAADEIDELFHVVLLHGDTSVIRCVNGSSCYSFYFIYDAVNMEEVVSTLSVQTVALRAACYPPRRRSCNDGKVRLLRRCVYDERALRISVACAGYTFKTSRSIPQISSIWLFSATNGGATIPASPVILICSPAANKRFCTS